MPANATRAVNLDALESGELRTEGIVPRMSSAGDQPRARGSAMVQPMLLLRLLGFVLDLILYPLRALRRGKLVPEGTFLTLKIDGAVMDVIARPRFWRCARRRRSRSTTSESSSTMRSPTRVSAGCW